MTQNDEEIHTSQALLVKVFRQQLHSLMPAALKGAATDMRYFARSRFSKGLAHKKKLS